MIRYNLNAVKYCESRASRAVLFTGNVREPSMLEVFQCEKVVCPVTGGTMTIIKDDVYLLLELEKKKKLSPESLSSIVDAMNNSSHSDALSSLRSKLDDDQILSLVKSRHLQAPSDLVKWNAYLDSLSDAALKDFCSDLESKFPKAPEPEKIQKVEVVNAPKSE